jgi:hypothetical protein
MEKLRMTGKNNLKWQYILWSVVVIFGLTLTAYVKYMRSDGIIGFDIYPYVLEPYVIISSLIIALLRILRVISNESFLYIFIAAVSLFIGAIGVYLNMTGVAQMSILSHSMFYLNVLIAIIIFFDVFRKRETK